MKEAEACENMEDIREAIDTLDRSVMETLSIRYKYVIKAADFKTSPDEVRAKERFKDMIEVRRTWAEELQLPADLIEQLYTNMVNFFINEEMKKKKKK